MDIALILAVVAYALVERLLGRKDVSALLDQVTSLVASANDERTKLLEEFSRERAELLLRIQHPAVIVPPRMNAPETVVEEDEDELELVGTVAPPPLPDVDTDAGAEASA